MWRLLEILDRLRAAGVEHVVVGGVAVVLHGHTRLTVDLDLALDLASANVRAAVDVLTEEGLVPRLPVSASDFAEPSTREAWVRDRHLVAFTMHDPRDARLEVDLLATTPIAFEDLARDAVNVDVAGHHVRVASLDHLMEMKRASGRPQDVADIEALEAIRRRSTLEDND
jgi:hypothetical protein